MMKQSMVLLFSTIFIFLSQLSALESQSQNKIQWLSNYEEAINLSKSSSKPVILFFTGSDWCTWCNKLEEEVLNTAEFYQDAGSKFIFVKLDFPLNSPLSPQLTAQNKQLQKKYDIRSFPTIILLDGQSQQQIGITGYRQGGGKQYATHLFKMVNDFSTYRDKMQNLEQKKFSSLELKHLYERAKEIGQESDANRLMMLGMQSEHPQFFMTERYRFLVNEGRLADKEAVLLKKRLLELDPSNEYQTHYLLAVIDFEACCENSDNHTPEAVVAPLIAYIDRFGKQDQENLWRLQMIISQVFFDGNDLNRALKFAQDSYESAPSSVKPEIATAVKNIKSQIFKK